MSDIKADIAELKDWMSTDVQNAYMRSNRYLVESCTCAEYEKLTDGERLKELAEGAFYRFKAAQKIFNEHIAPYASVTLNDGERDKLKAAVSDMLAQAVPANEAMDEMKAILNADYDQKVSDGTYSVPRPDHHGNAGKGPW